MSFKESLSRATFEVSFEGMGSLFVSKSQIGDQTPRLKFTRMRRFTFVVVVQALLQVTSDTHVMLLPEDSAFDEVNVGHAAACSLSLVA
jgi:hypothetical protein